MRNDGNLDNGWSDGGRREGQKYICSVYLGDKLMMGLGGRLSLRGLRKCQG